ncbi:hypothetical protein PAXINDRAFT_80791 [Paxillus involutus ATCC 200175]|uniref:Uncharacterized protein n=1 Tax=Paxillus involutus ATCC 200175 TaxID=664439 RepID=A0A0C9TDD6_PAXIN|nr:hypothetical protein PAXINDRAFT_80791 [Paxillus involutus ATCC 200175]
MHLAMNISNLLLSLWRGTMDIGPSDNIESWDWAVFRNDDKWQAHGKLVEKSGAFLPGSYDRRPRNIAEKLHSGYKTSEFQLYTFGVGPALLYGVLPELYWNNYCKLVRGFQLMCQHRITSQDLVSAHVLLCNWEREFELIYYQMKEDRLQFVCPCVHQVNHLAKEAILKGPPICYAQWTMERTIGNLGQEIRQPSRPYENLSQEGLRRCKVNALLAAMPELNSPPKGLPSGSVNLGDGFALLRKRDKNPTYPTGAAAGAIRDFLGDGHPLLRIRRWARILLPNGQTARTKWREQLKSPEHLRVSRNVKMKLADQIRFGEVLYFTRLPVEDAWQFLNIAIIQLYSMPDLDLLKISSQTVPSCKLLPDVIVLPIKQITSVIAMIPHQPTLPSGVTEPRFFMVEKPGLDMSNLGVKYEGFEDDDEGEDDDLE